MRKLLFFLFFVICLVFVSQTAFGVTLESNGQTHIVTQGNLRFETDGHGRIDLFRENLHVAEYAFSMRKTINGIPDFINSWDADWTWQVLSNTDDNVTVLGSATLGGFGWEQYWYFSNSEQKFAHFVENQTGFDSTNTQMYFVVDVNNTNTQCLNYVNHQGRGQEYCFGPDITITQNLGQYLKQVSFLDTMFGFEDLIRDGFEFNYLFAGVLNNANANLPSTNGLIIGVTKNNGLFPDGARVILDPTIIDTSLTGITNYGNTIARNDAGDIWIVYEAVAASTNTDIFVAKSTDNGTTFSTFNITSTSDFNESFPQMDINSTGGLIIAYDKRIATGAAATTDIFVTTCSAGDCDAAVEFLSDINVSACGVGQECSHVGLEVDVNDTSHMTYAFGSGGRYRQNTGFVGSDWNGAVATNLDTGAVLSSTGIIVAKNGSDRRLTFANANGAQVTASYFNGTVWSSNLLLANPQINTPPSGFAGYDGNFYLTYTQGSEAANAPPKNIHLARCIITDDCSMIGNWVDLNVTETPSQNDYFVSLMQAIDLNVYISSSARVNDADANIHLYTRLPDGTITTSSIADGNLLFNDTNQLYNPLLRNRDYRGSVLDGITTTPIGNIVLDYTFLTTPDSNSPNTLLYDSNDLGDINGLIANFTVTPPSPFILDPENAITNINVDFNNTTQEFGILDRNFSWRVNGTEESTDQNFNRDFNGSDTDFNISLIVNGNDGTLHFTSQNDQNILLRTNAQNVDINFTYNDFANNVDMNFGVTASGIINFAVWGFPNDQNQSGILVNKTYSTDGIKQVCVIVNTTGDVNKLHCENFTSTRVLVLRPKDKVTDIILTPFDVSTNDITRQAYLGQVADLNVFLFFQSGDDQNVLFIVDFNADYFSSTYLIQTNDSNTFQTIQPFLIMISEGLSAVFHVINAITQNTIPDVVIESRQGGVLIESTITDSTGSATLNFIVGDTYNLTFIVQGIVSLEQELRPIDTEYFIYLFLEEIITTPQDPETITVIFDPSIGQVQEGADGNFTLTQTISAARGTITLINIQVDQNGLLFFDSNFTGVPTGGVFSQDFNASMFAPNTSTVNVTVIVTSSLINQTRKSISYFIQFTSQATFLNAINALGLNLGDVGRIVLVVLSSFVVIGGFAQATRNPQILGAIVILWVGAFTAIGLNENYVVWIPLPVFLFAVIGAAVFYINR